MDEVVGEACFANSNKHVLLGSCVAWVMYICVCVYEKNVKNMLCHTQSQNSNPK